MLYCLSNPAYRILEKFIVNFGSVPGVPHPQMPVMTYGDLDFSQPIPAGVYLFVDLERLLVPELAMVKALAQRMRSHPDSYQVLNDPNHWLPRFDLLRDLFNQGINEFNVYRLRELKGRSPAKLRFPVFLRMENDHHGQRSELLGSYDEIWAAVKRLPLREFLGQHRAMVIEYSDTSDASGLFRKYSAFNLNGVLKPFHIFFNRQWMVKNNALINESTAAEEVAYTTDFPEAKLIVDVFRRSGTEFGRIDYSLKPDGRVQVWEINTNPNFGSPIETVAPLRRPRVTKLFREMFQVLEDLVDQRPTGPDYRLFMAIEAQQWSAVQQLGRWYDRWRR